MSKSSPNSAPAQLDDQIFDLELDYKDRGGIQRYKTVGEFKDWLQRENEFWGWLGQNPANPHFNRTNLNNTFRQYHGECTNFLARAENDWKNPSAQLHRLNSIKDEQETEAHKQEIQGYEKQCEQLLTNLQNNLKSTIERLVINSGSHICQHEPDAQFVVELAKSDPTSAAYALEFLIKEKQNANAENVLQTKGHLLASFYRQGLSPSEETTNHAFQKATETWSQELAGYREKYEVLKADYESLKSNNRQANKRWDEKTAGYGDQFAKQLENNEQDLSNLKETYESHMVLEAPVKYWRAKRMQHNIAIKHIQKLLIRGSIIAALVIGIAAVLLLPDFHPSETIPWRNLGLFALISTLGLWFIRLMVKLLLSNIHLSADAREREVMIQTFMAMMRHKESRDGVSKEDIAIVLAPIFKPSTSGVIKDEGGPVTLTDFITRMTGK